MSDTSTLVKTAGEFVIGSLTNTINSFLNTSSLLALALHEKPCFLFPNVLKRWSFQNNRSGIWPLFYYQQKWYFFFLKISSYSLDKKWKMIFLKKINSNMIFSSNVLKRWYFQINWTGIWSCLYYLKRWCFFFRKIWYFFFEQKIFLKKYIELRYFLYTWINVTNKILPFCKKVINYFLPKKCT